MDVAKLKELVAKADAATVTEEHYVYKEAFQRKVWEQRAAIIALAERCERYEDALRSIQRGKVAEDDTHPAR